MRRAALAALVLVLAGCKARPREQLSPVPHARGLDASTEPGYEAYERALVAALSPLASQPDAGALADAIDQTTARVQRDSGLAPETLHAWEALTVDVFRVQPPGAGAQVPRSEVSPRAAPDPLADVRRAFGDAAVDAVLAHEAELYKLHLERAQVVKRLSTAAGG